MAKRSESAAPLELLIEITVCPRERGTVRLPVEKGGRRRRMDAGALARQLDGLIAARGLAGQVWVSEGCAGGCWLRGPNVNVNCFVKAPSGEAQDHVAIRGKSYVYSLARLLHLGQLIDENLPGSERRQAPARGRSRDRARRR